MEGELTLIVPYPAATPSFIAAVEDGLWEPELGWLVEQLFSKLAKFNAEANIRTESVPRDILKAPHLVDVGAGIGYFTLRALKANPTAGATVIEPQPINSYFLRMNIAACPQELGARVNILQDLMTSRAQQRIGVGRYLHTPAFNFLDAYLLPQKTSPLDIAKWNESYDSVSYHETGTIDDLILPKKNVWLLKIDVSGTEVRCSSTRGAFTSKVSRRYYSYI